MMKKRLILIAVTVLLCGLLAVGIILVSGMELLPPETVICRLTVTGDADQLDREALRRQLEPEFLALEIRDETQPPEDLWAACKDGTLRGMTLDILKARYDGGDRETAVLAARYVLAALEGREAP